MDQRNAAIQKEGCQGLTNERIEKRAASSGARVSEQARSLQKREEGRREGCNICVMAARRPARRASGLKAGNR